MNKAGGVALIVTVLAIWVSRTALSLDQTVNEANIKEDVQLLGKGKFDPNFQPKSQLGKELKPLLVSKAKMEADFEKSFATVPFDQILEWEYLADPKKRAKLKASIEWHITNTVDFSAKQRANRDQAVAVMEKHEASDLSIQNVLSEGVDSTRICRMHVDILQVGHNIVLHVEASRLAKIDGKVGFVRKQDFDQLQALYREMGQAGRRFSSYVDQYEKDRAKRRRWMEEAMAAER